MTMKLLGSVMKRAPCTLTIIRRQCSFRCHRKYDCYQFTQHGSTKCRYIVDREVISTLNIQKIIRISERKITSFIVIVWTGQLTETSIQTDIIFFLYLKFSYESPQSPPRNVQASYARTFEVSVFTIILPIKLCKYLVYCLKCLNSSKNHHDDFKNKTLRP